MAEEWRPVVGHENRYAISSLGRVKALGRPGAGKGTRATDLILKQQIVKRASWKGKGKADYRVHLVRDGQARSKPHLVQRLVALAFLGERTAQRPQINHKDGNPLNNRVENLEWCSASENIRHALATGLYTKRTHCPKGHEFTPENSVYQKGRPGQNPTRKCRECRNAKSRRRYASRTIGSGQRSPSEETK